MPTSDASPEVIAAHQLPAPRASIFRMAVPLLYASMGVALGTLAGVSVALANPQGGILEAIESLIPISSTSPDLSVDAAEKPVWADGPAQAVTKDAAGTGKHKVQPADSTSTNSDTDNSATDKPAKIQSSPETQKSRAQIPAVPQKPALPAAPIEKHQAKPSVHPYAGRRRTELAGAPEVVPVAMDEQLSLDEDAKPSSFYTEGDITVANYDPVGRTIETNDGRTFVIGVTVSTGNATSWQDYRSSLHYRCDQNGSCTLVRAGAITLNARLI